MYFCRALTPSVDGPLARVLVARGPEGPWVDVRLAEQVRLERSGAGAEAARRIAAAVAPGSMAAAIAGGDAFLEASKAALDEPGGAGAVDGEPHQTLALDPSGYRDYMIFEGHFSFGFRMQDWPVPSALYELPVAYQGNPGSFIGTGAEVPWPSYTQHMDYELELGIVVGRPGSDLDPEEAADHIFGFTILNDISARDIQFQEMQGRLGPCKGKHFACAVGPLLATADEVDWRGGLRMQARVNGETLCDASSGEAIWGLDEVVAWTSKDERIEPGWLLGSGTVNGGSMTEIGRRLSPGDVIEMEIEGLGVLRNRVAEPAAPGWWPQPREQARS